MLFIIIIDHLVVNPLCQNGSWQQQQRCDNRSCPKKNGFSAIWSHFGFKPDSEYETTPVCRLCGKDVAAKSGHTSNLFSHLKHKHPSQYALLQQKKPVSSTSTSTTTSSTPTIMRSFEHEKPYLRSSQMWITLTDSVSYAIGKDMLPFTTVEKSGFKKMLATFDPRYELPSHQYFLRQGYRVFTTLLKALSRRNLKRWNSFLLLQTSGLVK